MSEQDSIENNGSNETHGAEVTSTGDDLLSNLQISEEAKSQIQNNSDLLNVLTHSIQSKRSANSEAKKYREELEQLRAANDEAEKAKLKEQGEFKKLYEESQNRLKEKEAEINRVTINNKVSLLASSKGIKKSEYLKMFDLSGLEVDSNLDVPGLAERFENFYTDNPDLFNGNGAAKINIDSTKPSISGSSNVMSELKMLEDKAKRGLTRDIVRLREFKKANGIK